MTGRAWDELAGRNPFVGFIDISLRGASQVFFQNNALTGFIILAAIFWAGYAGASFSVACGAVTGLVVATFTAILLNADLDSLKQGLFGFNGVLVGAALPTFLARQPLMWAYVVIGAAVSTVFTLAVANVVRHWGVPGSTAPFVFTTWVLLLSAYSLAGIPVAAMGPPGLPAARFTAEVQFSAGSLGSLAGVLAKNVSQVYLVENVVTGILFVVAIAFNSLRSAAFAIVGSVVGLTVAAACGANGNAIHAGLYGFSAVLTAMAVGAVFNPPSFRATVYAIVATIFTVIVQAAFIRQCRRSVFLL